ncbi:ribosome-associated translation inhibitor RaiA [Rhizobiaceae bacterium]|nr:ribosome-associated translation inhibitor RaiA [Rhizobiaceae bacterium]
MTLRISGKQMELGDSFRARIEDRIDEAVSKYFGHGYSGHVTVEKEGNAYMTDCIVHLDSGVVLQASARDNGHQASFDQAADRIETRLRRYTRKLKSRTPHHSSPEQIEVAYTTFAFPQDDEVVAEDFVPAIVAESFTTAKTLSVAQAVMQLDVMDAPVHVFRNAGSGAVNIVYRRADGHVGWVDPSADKTAKPEAA